MVIQVSPVIQAYQDTVAIVECLVIADLADIQVSLVIQEYLDIVGSVDIQASPDIVDSQATVE